MNKEEKEFLLKDLCARLPYGVIVHFCHTDINEKLTEISLGETITHLKENGKGNQGEVLPYLRSMSSMTEEEIKELGVEMDKDFELAKISFRKNDIRRSVSGFNKIDWLNAHHFDYRGLIEKGLALEAPEYMYKRIISYDRERT